jgi:hypothetical protein
VTIPMWPRKILLVDLATRAKGKHSLHVPDMSCTVSNEYKVACFYDFCRRIRTNTLYL